MSEEIKFENGSVIKIIPSTENIRSKGFHFYVNREEDEDFFDWLKPCCDNEKRELAGGCINCGDTCF